MIEALVSGKLIRESTLKVGASGKSFCNVLLSVAVGDPQNIVVSGIAFGAEAEKIVKLGKLDALSVVGSIRPTEWTNSATGELHHGLSVTISSVLTPYDIKKRRPTQDNPAAKAGNAPHPFNDNISF